jgi:CheY-like chemotaxis protein
MENPCILIVEDHQDFLELLKHVANAEGCYPVAVEDCNKAIELLKHVKPKIISTDIMMPDTCGIDLINHVRNSPRLEDIPILVISAAGEEALTEAVDAGATMVLRKPIDLCEFIRILREYIPAQARTGSHSSR